MRSWARSSRTNSVAGEWATASGGAGPASQAPVPAQVKAPFTHPTRTATHQCLIQLLLLSYLLRFWGNLVHQSALPTDGPPLPATVLLHKLLPGRPDLVDEAVRSVQEGRPWKKVGIITGGGHSARVLSWELAIDNNFNESSCSDPAANPLLFVVVPASVPSLATAAGVTGARS